MSFFRSTRSKTSTDQGKHKRSRSVDRTVKELSRYEEHAQGSSSEGDVATRICTEIATAVLRAPDVNTGVLGRTAGASRRGMNKTNTMVVVAAAILAHIGNVRMSKRMLDKSSACTGYYKDLGLEDSKLRSVFVTMMFAINPGFLTMLETSLMTAMERMSSKGGSPSDTEYVVNSLKSLYGSNTITGKELESIAKRSTSSGSESADYPVLEGVPETVIPDDSVTRVDQAPSARKRINEAHLRSYMMSTRTGPKEDFYDVFPAATKPIAIPNRPKRTGLGFTEDQQKKVAEGKEGIPDVNHLLYGVSVPTANLKTGEVKKRPPKVEDLPSTSTMSETAAIPPTEVAHTDWSHVRDAPKRRPSPTEFTLPTSFGGATEATAVKPEAKLSSKEDLNQFLVNMGIIP